MKKLNALKYLTKLATLLDSKNLNEASDLADKIANNLAKDILSGGKSDNIPTSFFDDEEIEIGLPEEIEEHTTNPDIGLEIVKDHLMTDPNYYTKELE
jgi:hypothetical protein